ncbi:MAG TPA: hypothetical protein VF618_04420 [Thermoanaerobaculia bacterium]
MHKEDLLQLNDEQVEAVVAADSDTDPCLPRCTMTLAYPPEEPVCEFPWQ